MSASAGMSPEAGVAVKRAARARPGKRAASALVASVLLSALPGAAGAAERVALVIGNGAYEKAPYLANPRNDAADVGAALDRLGFEVSRLANADQAVLREGLRNFTRAASAAEVAVVFYAGHGIEVDGRNFLVPVDARLQSDQDVEFETVSLELVMRSVERARGLRLVILDACRNNPFAESMQRAGATRSIGRGLARAEPRGETLLAYAAKGGSVAADGKEGSRNSPYTGALLRYLEEPGLDVGDMFRKVRDEVLTTTGGVQEPFTYGSLPGRDIYLASGAPPPPPPPPPEDKDTTASAAGGTPPPPPGDPAKVAYEAAERVGAVAAFLVVIEDFPGSTYAKLARVQIARLEEKPVVVGGGAPGGDEEVAPPVAPPSPSPEEEERGLGLSREERRLVQLGLSSAGHDPGLADGVFGGRTREALVAWQSSKRMDVTGHLTREQSAGLVALGREEAERKAREAEERERQRAEADRRARAEERRRAEEKRRAEVGRKFRDCPRCPELVVVPSGSYMMGSPSGEEYRSDSEGPVHRVTFERPFAVGVYEVTFGEWDACVEGGGCGGYRPPSQNWGEGRRPVMNVSWDDAKGYVAWLSRKTGEEYRMLSESEWEYVARAGTVTRYWWGDAIGRNRANCDGCGSRWDGGQTSPVGSFAPNGFGLHDVHGNVWEWVEDCWHDSYRGAPTDGRAWTVGGDCGRRVLRGGSWGSEPGYLRSADRDRNSAGVRSSGSGFRVARTLD